MPETPQLSLAVGDRVVYPKQGVCRIASVEAKEVAGQKLTFVTMQREEDGAVVMVPQGKIVSIGVRKIAGQDEVKRIFSFLSEDTDKADLDWKQRARANLDRMSQGGLQGLAEVVKGLQVLSELRPLPAKERELYDSAPTCW
jgi:RNA polymerase-interacting CarD/CdnL/TRCF family regulator